MDYNYYTYKDYTFTCRKCKWQGKGSETKTGELFDAVFEIDCPICHEPVGCIGYPTKEQIHKYGSEKEKQEIKEIWGEEEQNSKVVSFAKSGEIDPEKVKNVVYNRIHFELPEWLWDKINNAFGECWNKEIGIRGWVHEGQIEKFIYKKLQEENIMFDYSKIERIVKVILDYIKMSGGFLDD